MSAIQFLPLTSPVGKPYVPGKKESAVKECDVATDGAFIAVTDAKLDRSDSSSSELEDAPTEFRARTESN